MKIVKVQMLTDEELKEAAEIELYTKGMMKRGQMTWEFAPDVSVADQARIITAVDKALNEALDHDYNVEKEKEAPRSLEQPTPIIVQPDDDKDRPQWKDREREKPDNPFILKDELPNLPNARDIKHEVAPMDPSNPFIPKRVNQMEVDYLTEVLKKKK